jgi:hypothetical protein
MENGIISIITPTIRKEGLDVVKQSIKKQTYPNWEWLIGSPFDPEIPEATWVKDDFEGGYWSLNRIYNRLFARCRGSIIVSWQDWIYANPDGLQKFYDCCTKTGGVVSGVGDQYERINKFGRPEVLVWSDPRKTEKYGSFYECYWNDAEFNYCGFKKEHILAVGGMDERLDFLGFGGDQLQLCERIDSLGIPFYLDQTNISYTVRHSRDSAGGQENWDSNHVLFNGEYDKRKRELVKSGEWPHLDFLI